MATKSRSFRIFHFLYKKIKTFPSAPVFLTIPEIKQVHDLPEEEVTAVVLYDLRRDQDVG